MIIKIGNESLLPWIAIPYADKWVRAVEYGSINRVELKYDTFAASWWPQFSGNMNFLKPMFEERAVFDNHKYKHHQSAMDQMDKFLIRMGKITIFM